MTTSWSRCSVRHLQYCRENLKTLHKHSKWCQWRCRSVIICLRLNDCRKTQFRCALLLISFKDVVGCILPSRLSQFVRLDLLLPKPHHTLLYCFGGCAHHPAGFVIFAQPALLNLFNIIFCPILLVIGSCKITQTVTDTNQHLLKRLFKLSGHQSPDFTMRNFVLVLLNSCLCMFNSLSYPSGFSLNIVLNPFLFFFVAYEECFSSFLHRKLLFGSHSAQCPKGSDSLCLQAAVALIRLMTSFGWPLCRFAISARQKWQKVLSQSFDHCSLYWFCSWARCRMLQVIDNMKAGCIFYGTVGTFTHLEWSKICFLTGNKSGIVTLTVQHAMIDSVIFI